VTEDNEFRNILTYGKLQGTIELKPYPDEILDVDPKIIASMKARLRGESTAHIYDITDRVIDEVALAREKKKILKVLSTIDELHYAFSSTKNIAQIQEEFVFESVDKAMLSDYAYVISHQENVDEFDFLNHFLFGEKLQAKKERNISDSNFLKVFQEYQMKHFDWIKLNREIIEMDSILLKLFREKKLLGLYDELLSEFYGRKI
jgi:hypothetical protein